LTVHPRYGTPWLAILFCAGIYIVLTTFFSFIELIELNVTLYSASLVPELLALLWLRVKEPDLPRPYRIPGGWPVLLLVVFLPIVVSLVGFAASLADPEEGWRDQIPVLVLLASGPIVYWVVRAFRRSQPAAL
jgi:amino acid transporter